VTADQLTFDSAAAGMRAVTEASDEISRNAVDQAIKVYADRGTPFSIESFRDLLPDVRPALIGARFSAAAKRGLIRAVGFEQSTKPSTHGAWVRVWTGVPNNSP
jgi:hypothetical protein